jgi:hypothetical protein
MPNQYTTKGQPKRTRIVLVRLTDDEYAVLAMIAAEYKCTVSEFVRYQMTFETIGDAQVRSMFNRLRSETRKLRASRGAASAKAPKPRQQA